MKRKKIMQITIIVFVAIGILAGISIAYSRHVNIANNRNKKVVEAHAVKLPKKEVDISKIQISKEVEDVIRKTDSKNADKNIKNYKMLIGKLEVPETYRVEIGRLIKDGYKVPDTLIAYEFLYDNYGQMKELEQLLKKKRSDISWTKVFEDYSKDEKEFKPRDFDPKELDKLMNTPGISTDDIMNADRISQMGLKPFDELIDLRKSGKTWNAISIGLGILNTSEKMPIAELDNSKVDKYCKEINMTRDEVINALLLAAKTNLKDDDVIKWIKKGKSKEFVYEQYYDFFYK